MKTSEHLIQGKVYSREDLKTRFGIADATINTGIFRPKDHNSIWLFVTKNKTPDRVQYQNDLQGNDLFMDSQTAGMKDPVLIEHKLRGLEILVFYREEKYEHPNAGFTYEGVFEYAEHKGTHPARFHFRRIG